MYPECHHQGSGRSVTCNDCDVCVIAEVGTGNYYVRQGKASSASANLKTINGNKAVSGRRCGQDARHEQVSPRSVATTMSRSQWIRTP